jgi:tight adherence protein C
VRGSRLGVEAAIDRVAGDIGHKSEVLSEELSMDGLELRAGSDRRACPAQPRHAHRVEEVEAWVALIIQPNASVTSIASALRIIRKCCATSVASAPRRLPRRSR